MFTMEVLSIAGIVGILLVWLLVPLIPAILIFKLFPKTLVAANGPFAGLTLNMGGAFAAYFILCLMSYSWVGHAYVALGDLKRLAWTVKGTFQMVDKDGKVIHPGDEFFSRICVRTLPVNTAFQDTDEAGQFEFSVPEMARKLPILFVETNSNKRIMLKVDEVDQTEKIATIRMLTIPGMSNNNSEVVKPQTQAAQTQ